MSEQTEMSTFEFMMDGLAAPVQLSLENSLDLEIGETIDGELGDTGLTCSITRMS